VVDGARKKKLQQLQHGSPSDEDDQQIFCGAGL
jgi:hypothetical protein